ncbi:MAG: hypothetical protein AAF533_09750 [Acidobacteriota bacterium]
MESPPDRAPACPPLLTLALGLTCFVLLVPGALLKGETFFDGDLSHFHRPIVLQHLRLLAESDGPASWNPLPASGQPMAANPVLAPTHPFTLLFRVLPFELAFRLNVLLPIAISFLGAWFLLRCLSLSSVAATLGALCWAFGGTLLSCAEIWPALATLAPLPFTLAFALRVLREGRVLDGLGLALSFGLQCLRGEPTVLLLTPLLLLVLLVEARRANGDAEASSTLQLTSHLRRRLGLTGLALVLGAALGSATLVPAWQLLQRTDRGAEAGPDVDTWSLPPVRLVELASPHVYGRLEDPAARRAARWSGALYDHGRRPFLGSLHAGLIALVLALVALVLEARRLLPWTLVGAACLLAAFGSHFVVWDVVRRVVPLLGTTRYPEKLWIPCALVLTVAAALGAQRVLVDDDRRARRLALGLFTTAAVLGLLFVGSLGPRLLLVAGTGVGACLLRPHWRVALVLLTVVLDLGTAGRTLVRTRPVDALPLTVPPVLAPLAATADDGPLWNQASYDPRTPTLSERHDTWRLQAWNLATTLDRDDSLTQLAWTRRAKRLVSEALERDGSLLAPLLHRRSVQAVLRVRTPLVGDRSPYELLRPRSRRPFASCVRRVETFATDEDWHDLVDRLGPALVDAVLVEEDQAEEAPTTPSTCTVDIVERHPDRLLLSVSVEGPAPAFLALAQTWDPGWQATLDDTAVRLRRSDVDLTGVLLPPGASRLELVHDEPSLGVGRWLSLSALLVLIGGAAIVSRDLFEARQSSPTS